MLLRVVCTNEKGAVPAVLAFGLFDAEAGQRLRDILVPGRVPTGHHVVLDLSGIEGLTSEGLHGIEAASDALAKRACSVLVVAPSTDAQHWERLAGRGNGLRLAGSLDQALAIAANGAGRESANGSAPARS